MRILWFSNPSYGCYGYSIVTKNVVEGLRKAGHDVIIAGNVTSGNIIKDDRGNKNIPMLFDGWGNDVIEHYLKAYDIDLMVYVLDTWMDPVQFIPKLTKSLKVPLIAHATIRAAPLSPFMARFFVESDHIVVPSKFGYGVAMELPDLRGKTSYIPHGVDLDVFKPLPEIKEKMKKRLGYDDKFVFLSVGRNNFYMKQYPIMFHAYKILLDNVPEARKNTIMHIHCYPNEPNSINLNMLRGRGGLQDYVKFSHVRPKPNWEGIELCAENDPRAMINNPNFGLNEEEMAKMYNMADTHIMTTEGESFGLPIIESQACGIPQIFPNNTVGPELIGNVKAGLLASVKMEYTTPLICDVGYADSETVAKCMHHMYTKPDDRKEFSENAMANARNYSWKRVIPMWIDLIERVYDGSKSRVDYEKGDMGV